MANESYGYDIAAIQRFEDVIKAAKAGIAKINRERAGSNSNKTKRAVALKATRDAFDALAGAVVMANSIPKK